MQAGTAGVGIEGCGRPLVDLSIGLPTDLSTGLPTDLSIDLPTDLSIGLPTVPAGAAASGTTAAVEAVASGTAAAGTGDVRTYLPSSPTSRLQLSTMHRLVRRPTLSSLGFDQRRGRLAYGRSLL
jgi:hypothetical protein